MDVGDVAIGECHLLMSCSVSCKNKDFCICTAFGVDIVEDVDVEGCCITEFLYYIFITLYSTVIGFNTTHSHIVMTDF